MYLDLETQPKNPTDFITARLNFEEGDTARDRRLAVAAIEAATLSTVTRARTGRAITFLATPDILVAVDEALGRVQVSLPTQNAVEATILAAHAVGGIEADPRRFDIDRDDFAPDLPATHVVAVAKA